MANTAKTRSGFGAWLLDPKRRGALLVAPAITILFVMNIQIYFLSPPFGPACFWLKSVAPPEITLQDIFLAVLPFFGLQLIGLTLVIIFPEIVMFLPNLMSG